MELQGWITLAVVAGCLFVMVRELAPPDLTMMAGLVTLAVTGVLAPEEAFAGFANPALAAVGALFIVSAALRETGALDLVAGRLFRGASDERSGLLRLCTPVSFFSAFLNNAPIVAMMTPTVSAWAQRHQLAPSRFLIPLSYSSILGSITTVIGTSTILTVSGLIHRAGMPELGFFELAPVGIPIAIVGLLYLTFVSPHLLPVRRDTAEYVGDHYREYTASMIVGPDCTLIDQTVAEAGLRGLPGLFLVEIERDRRTMTPIGPDEVLLAGDRLVFAGVVTTIVELAKIRGLQLVGEEDQPVHAAPAARAVEAVISRSSPLVGRSVRATSFRSAYDAAVIAVHRNGERVGGKIGDIVLRPGDTLLLHAAPGFMRSHRHSRDFFLTSEVQESEVRRHDKAGIAMAILGAMVVISATGVYPIYIASFMAAGALIATRCIRGSAAREAVIWQVLIVIGAGLGIGAAMEKTGASTVLAHLVTDAAGGWAPLVSLAIIYVITVVMAEMLHHNASVAIMFPVAVAVAQQVGADPRAFVVAVALGGCCAFATPTGYQTHLIVYGPGGYRFTDFVRVGIPLDILCGIVAIALIPLFWPL
jgi:di/tricarboxylate transporter